MHLTLSTSLYFGLLKKFPIYLNRSIRKTAPADRNFFLPKHAVISQTKGACLLMVCRAAEAAVCGRVTGLGDGGWPGVVRARRMG